MYTSPVRSSHFTLENPKKVIFQCYYLYSSDYLRYLRRKQIATVVQQLFAVYLLLFSASCYAHSPITASGARYGRVRVLILTCCSLRQRLVATRAEFRHSMVYCATDQCRMRPEACINAEGGHSEHLPWHCMPDIPTATCHNRFVLEPVTTTHNWLSSEPPAFERTHQTFSQMKKFCSSQVSVVTFQVGRANGLQFVFL